MMDEIKDMTDKTVESVKKTAKKVKHATKKGMKKVEEVVIDGKDTIVKKGTLGVATVVTATSVAANAAAPVTPVSSGIAAAPNENTIVLNHEVDEVAPAPMTLNAVAPASAEKIVDIFMTTLARQGATMVSKQLSQWGLMIANEIFKGFGLDFLVGKSATTPDYTHYFEQINEKLDAIQKSIDEIKIGIDQNETTRVFDNFTNEFSSIKTSVDPVIASLAGFADREKLTYDEAGKKALLEEEEQFYDSFIKNLKVNNSFAERVISLANLVSKPSSNAKNTLMKCYNSVSFDIPGIYTWDNQRVDSQHDFLAYVSATLMKAASVARYEISYRASHAKAESEKTFWNSTNDQLCSALDKALDVLQKDSDEVVKHKKNVQKGVFTHVATGIAVNRRLAPNSYDPKKGHNIMSYSQCITAGPKKARHTQIIRHMLLGPNDKLFENLMEEYKTYVAYINKTIDSYSFMQYLDHIGFITNNGSLTDYDGLHWKSTYQRVPGSSAMYRVNVRSVDKKGKQVDENVAKIKEKGAMKYGYNLVKGPGYSKRFLIFLQPNGDYALGNYQSYLVDLDDMDFDKLPYEFKYNEARSTATIGYCDPSW